MNAPLARIAQESIAGQLRAARKAARLSRLDLARLTGLSAETIAAMEKSGAGQVSTLVTLLDRLGCGIADQPIEMPLGDWLRLLRQTRCMGQRQAARLAGITQPTIGVLERSKGQIASLSKLLAAYDVPLRLTAAEMLPSPPTLGRRITSIDQFELYEGDCRERIKALIAEGRKVDTIIADAPYEADTLGLAWDRSGLAFDTRLWKLCREVMKPGAHLLVFGWPKTVHRVTSAIEDAGFEIRDPIAWLYSSGMPVGSKDVSRALDKRLGAIREVTGHQPPAGIKSSGASERQGLAGAYQTSQFTGERRDTPVTDEARQWVGFKTRLRPGREDIIVARKPLSEFERRSKHPRARNRSAQH